MLTYNQFFRELGVGKTHGHENLIRHPKRPDESEFVPNTDGIVHRVLPVQIGERARRILPADKDQMVKEFVKLRDKRAVKAPITTAKLGARSTATVTA
jgi:hypothetical protein